MCWAQCTYLWTFNYSFASSESCTVYSKRKKNCWGQKHCCYFKHRRLLCCSCGACRTFSMSPFTRVWMCHIAATQQRFHWIAITFERDRSIAIWCPTATIWAELHVRTRLCTERCMNHEGSLNTLSASQWLDEVSVLPGAVLPPSSWGPAGLKVVSEM